MTEFWTAITVGMVMMLGLGAAMALGYHAGLREGMKIAEGPAKQITGIANAYPVNEQHAVPIFEEWAKGWMGWCMPTESEVRYYAKCTGSIEAYKAFMDRGCTSE